MRKASSPAPRANPVGLLTITAHTKNTPRKLGVFWCTKWFNIRIFCCFNLGKEYCLRSVLEVKSYIKLIIIQVNWVHKPVYKPPFAFKRGNIEISKPLYTELYLFFRKEGPFYFLLQNGDFDFFLLAFKFGAILKK